MLARLAVSDAVFCFAHGLLHEAAWHDHVLTAWTASGTSPAQQTDFVTALSCCAQRLELNSNDCLKSRRI